MICNLHYYRLPDGTEVRASGPTGRSWLFFARDATLAADPLYVLFPEVSNMLYQVVSSDPRHGWRLRRTTTRFQDLIDLGL